MRLLALACLALPASFLVACAGPTTERETPDETAMRAETATWPSAAEAPTYDGAGFSKAQVYRVSDGKWVDERALEEAIGGAAITYFGEQHQTAPVQALERWVLAKTMARHADAGLAMEHFQRDEQAVIDRYFAGTIDQATFEAQAQPWPAYATYWRALVEDARAGGRPLFALNVPKETLSGIYGQFPKWPLEVFEGIPQTSAHDAWLPPRPVGPWTPAYQRWFEPSFDYASHGQGMGLSYADALRYFTDLAHIRDETMAWWTARALATSPHLLVVAGDWHVQTGLALPDRVAELVPTAASIAITTAPAPSLAELVAPRPEGRPLADYVITYR